MRSLTDLDLAFKVLPSAFSPKLNDCSISARRLPAGFLADFVVSLLANPRMTCTRRI